jgi:DNA (cytosine-5)-methyltransferase 1
MYQQKQLILDAQLRDEWLEQIKSKKPKLDSDAPIAVVMFSGGGGVEAGMVMAGIRPVMSIEYDPKRIELSTKLADMHHTNFTEYGCKVIRRSVQDVSRLGFPGFPQSPDFLHASPVCSNFSIAKTKAMEAPDDIEAAIAVSNAITILKPKVFTLEQVPAYTKSTSWKIIRQQLITDGYNITEEEINCADYGVPQTCRKRMIVLASKDLQLSLPIKSYCPSWYDAIADLILSLPLGDLIPGQIKSLEKYLSFNPPCPLLIQRTGARKEYNIQPSNKLAKTILRSIFTDGKGANRNRFLNIWLPGNDVREVSIHVAARLQTFPDWYEFDKSTVVAGSAIGYAVPPLLAKQLFIHILNDSKQRYHRLDVRWVSSDSDLDKGAQTRGKDFIEGINTKAKLNNITWKDIKDVCQGSPTAIEAIWNYAQSKIQKELLGKLPKLLAEYAFQTGDITDFSWVNNIIKITATALLEEYMKNSHGW